MISSTPTRCRGSVVRMKSSFAIPNSFQRFRNVGAWRSATTIGATPSFFATFRSDAHALPRLGRADEIVVRDPELFPEVPKRRCVAVGHDDRGDAFLFRDLLDVLAVLVRAGQKTHVLSREAEIAGKRIRDDRGVEMPDVGPVVDVVDRGREVAARHEESRIPRRRYGRRIARTRAAILSPIASEAVAAGD